MRKSVSPVACHAIVTPLQQVLRALARGTPVTHVGGSGSCMHFYRRRFWLVLARADAGVTEDASLLAPHVKAHSLEIEALRCVALQRRLAQIEHCLYMRNATLTRRSLLTIVCRVSAVCSAAVENINYCAAPYCYPACLPPSSLASWFPLHIRPPGRLCRLVYLH